MPFDDAGRPVFTKSLPTLPSPAERAEQWRDLTERWVADYHQPGFQLDLAHQLMIMRDGTLHDSATDAQLGRVGQMEFWARQWCDLDGQVAEHVAKAREFSDLEAEP